MKIFEFATLRNLFSIKQEFDSFDYQRNNALEILFPFENKYKAYRKYSNFTFSTTEENQIRFQLHDNIAKNFEKLICKTFQPNQVVIIHGIGSKAEKYFIHILKKIAKVEYKIIKNKSIILYPEEKEIINILNKKVINDADLTKAFSIANLLIYVGDHWSAINIFKILLKKSNCYKHKIIERLCIAYTCIGLVNKAEYYRTLCIEDSSCDENIKSRVLYSLALLYLRHHNKVQHNIDKAEQYLNLAYSIISKNKINASQFSKVFNRNGFALCLYKKGKINEAIELLKWGIRILNKEKNDKNKLHSSVLVYNLFLCFKALDKPMKAIIYLKKLIEDDPKMAEYRSELIYYLIQKSKVKVALVEINSAILNFPDYFIFYLQHGYILFKKKDFINAELLFSKAVMYNFANEDALYNLLLTKIKLKKQDWIVNQFKKNAFPHYIIENNPRINTIIQYALCSQ